MWLTAIAAADPDDVTGAVDRSASSSSTSRTRTRTTEAD